MRTLHFGVCVFLQIYIGVMSAEISVQEAIYRLSTIPSLGVLPLQAPMTNISRASCAVRCGIISNFCYSFSYNGNSQLCTLGTQVSVEYPTTTPEQGDMYIKDACNSTLGFKLLENENTSLCVFESTDMMNFSQSEQACAKMGAYLLTLSDTDKYDLFAATMGGRSDITYWMGMDDRAVEGQYVWSKDGSIVENFEFIRTYMFRDGQPDNVGGIDDCIAYWLDGLYDASCDYIRVYLCEKPPSGL